MDCSQVTCLIMSWPFWWRKVLGSLQSRCSFWMSKIQLWKGSDCTHQCPPRFGGDSWFQREVCSESVLLHHSKKKDLHSWSSWYGWREEIADFCNFNFYFCFPKWNLLKITLTPEFLLLSFFLSCKSFFSVRRFQKSGREFQAFPTFFNQLYAPVLVVGVWSGFSYRLSMKCRGDSFLAHQYNWADQVSPSLIKKTIQFAWIN